MAARRLHIAVSSDGNYVQEQFGGSPLEAMQSPSSPVSPNAFLPRAARTNLTHSIRSGGSPRGANIFLPGAHRADSIEAMLAEIPSRFSIQKSLSIGSASSSASSLTPLGVGHGARDGSAPEAWMGTAAIPSRRSREAPGLQPATSALRQPCGPPGSHVTQEVGTNSEIPRTFSGKVRKLKQHRRASASRLRPPETPPHPPEAPPEAPTSHAVVPDPTPAVTQHTQQQHQHADRVQSQASSVQQACHPQHAQYAQQRSNLTQPALQQLPLLMQPPGFGSEKKMLEQQVHAQLLHDKYAQPQLLGQLPQQLQQQPPMTKAGRRQRPTADAAGLACIGTGVQEEQGRMSQSGPLCQPSAVAPASAPVPEMFEAYQVRQRGRGTGTLDRRMASLDKLFQKMPPGDTRRRRRLQAVSQSAPSAPGALPCQGSFVLTPGTAAIPRELSLNPHSGARAACVPREISLNPQTDLGFAALPGEDLRADLGPETSPSLLLGLSDSPAVFEFARNPSAAHVRTAKLSQPSIPPQAAKLPRVEFGTPRAGQQGRAVHSSLEGVLVKNPRTSIEDLSQMQSCLNQLEQQLVHMPRPSSRGQNSRPQVAEADFANRGRLRTDIPTLHVQELGAGAFGAPYPVQNSDDSVSFLRPGSFTPRQDTSRHNSSRQDQMPHTEVASAGEGEEDEGRGSRPSSAGSVAQQPQFAVLMARVNARRQGNA